MTNEEMNEWQLLDSDEWDSDEWENFLDYQEEWYEINEEMNEL